MRINKYIASCGQYSRRKADELIANGNVKINGVTLKEAGYLVQEEDKVEVNGVLQKPETKKLYYALNKPLGYITSAKDEQDRPVVIQLLSDVEARLFPVGRLDYNTSGLLILTNDGNFAYALTHPKHQLPKTYRVKAKGYLSNTKLAKLRNGIDIGGFITSKAEVSILKQMKAHTLVEITIHEGKNRQIRKMFSAIGNPVEELERIAIGNLPLGRLISGSYRKISQKEVDDLLNIANKKVKKTSSNK